MNILIADDDSTSRIVLSATLKKLGHQVTVTRNGAEAWTTFETTEVPLLISDMVMPDVHGLELCRRIRAANRPKYTYIILLTSVGGQSGHLVGMRAGADDFINKPLDEEQLAVRLAFAELGLATPDSAWQPTNRPSKKFVCVARKPWYVPHESIHIR